MAEPTYTVNGKPKQNSHRGWKIFGIVAAALALAVIPAAVVYNRQQQKIDNLNSQVASLNDQLSKLKSGVTTAQQNQSSQSNQSSAATTSTTFTSQKGVNVVVYSPIKDATVISPLGVIGEVPGNWSSEASFPIILKDASGNVIAQTTGKIQGNWQTDKLVPFSAQLTYTTSPAKGTAGTLIIQKDNPSGDTSKADSVSIPIKF